MAPTGSGRVVLHRLRLCSRPTPKIWTVRWAASRDGSGKVLVPRVGVGMCADYCLAPDSQASMRTIAACLAYVIAPASDFTPVSYTHLRAHETGRNLVCRLL